ncbi:MAG TPA: ABC transporter permease [Hyphomicrobiaceae bacterium]|nr:ABC transporter permease [Hyphomicrobiaceae bacterium]
MLIETLKLALTAIRRNVLRSILTLLGVTIGVAAVVALVTLGQGTTASVSSSISSLGSNMLVVQPGQMGQNASAGGMSPLREDDATTIARQVGGITAVAPVAIRSLTAVAGPVNHFVGTAGVDNQFFVVRQWEIAAGRGFREGELVSGAASCILGKATADALFPNEDPLEQTVRLKKLVCRVIGVLAEKGSGTFGSNQDDIIVMPLHTFQRRISGNPDISAVYLAAESEDAITQVQTDVTALLRERRHLSASEDNDFTVMDMRQISSMLSSVMGILTGLLAAVASISLLVGGIGIMNIMLVSVTERTREIGIRLAIGARESQVLSQFLVEAVALSMLGGLAGIGLGLAAAAGGAKLLAIPFMIDPSAMLLAFGFSAVVGVGFGYFPARSAARLNPIEALRHE